MGIMDGALLCMCKLSLLRLSAAACLWCCWQPSRGGTCSCPHALSVHAHARRALRCAAAPTRSLAPPAPTSRPPQLLPRCNTPCVGAHEGAYAWLTLKYLPPPPPSHPTTPCALPAGAHEGAYAWLTLNYLLGKLGKGPAATVAAIDLGGGSVQEAFALPDDGAAAAPSGYVTKLRAGGNTYSVYVHRCAGVGM